MCVVLWWITDAAKESDWWSRLICKRRWRQPRKVPHRPFGKGWWCVGGEVHAADPCRSQRSHVCAASACSAYTVSWFGCKKSGVQVNREMRNSRR